MSNIIYFEPDASKHGFIMFVGRYRKRSLFRREKIEYSLSITQTIHENEWSDEDFERIKKRVEKDYPNAKVCFSSISDFMLEYADRRFYVICTYVSKYDIGYYADMDRDGKAEYTQDLEDVRVIMASSSALQTLRTIQSSTRDRVWIANVYLTLYNELGKPNFMITCTGRDTQNTRFFTKLDGNRVRSCATSDAATKFSYEGVINEYENLRIHNHNYLFAILPAFKDNVNAKNLEAYMKANKTSRQIVLDLKLKWLKLEKKKKEGEE